MKHAYENRRLKAMNSYFGSVRVGKGFQATALVEG